MSYQKCMGRHMVLETQEFTFRVTFPWRKEPSLLTKCHSMCLLYAVISSRDWSLRWVFKEIFIISKTFLFLLHSQAHLLASQRKHSAWVFKPDEEMLQDLHSFTEAVRRNKWHWKKPHFLQN